MQYSVFEDIPHPVGGPMRRLARLLAKLYEIGTFPDEE